MFTIELALGHVEERYVSDFLGGATYYAEQKEESEDAEEEDNGPIKVAVTEQMAFVYVGAL